MKIREYLISKGVSEPIAIYTEFILMQKAKEILSSEKEIKENPHLASLFMPLGEDIFECKN